MSLTRLTLVFFLLWPAALTAISQDDTVTLRGKIIDAANGSPLPARLYIESADKPGKFFLARSAGGQGKSAPYQKRRGEKSVEIHTCLSADAFEASLPPGKYRLTAERGHEYLTTHAEVTIPSGGKIVDVELNLERWIHLAERGWFSGDTHCHRTLDELPVVLLAEDLNVGLPLTAWVTDSTHTPAENNKNPDEVPPPDLIRVDAHHVIWPVNTEYEIFSVDGERHPLGAVFVLNHRETLDLAVPPVGPVAEATRKQGGLLDLDKHNWPWSMMLLPVMDVRLFELTNNHVWRTEFAFTNWYTDNIGDYMNIPLKSGEGEKKHLDERGWLDFGFKNYYALLNCGLRIMPSAGTASGVHPVPLGFGRVYARMPETGGAFSYNAWIKSLRAGRTFVTTGPMLFVTVDEKHPGSTLEWKPKDRDEAEESGGLPVLVRVESQHPINKLELIINGDVTELEIGGPIGAKAPHSCFARAAVEVERSSWVAVRVFTETENGRSRFAHTAPFWIEVKDKPIRPKLLETDYLLKRVRAEIKRHQGLLSDEALAEFEKAEAYFEERREAASPP